MGSVIYNHPNGRNNTTFYTTYIPRQLVDHIYYISIHHRSHLWREPFGFTPIGKKTRWSFPLFGNPHIFHRAISGGKWWVPSGEHGLPDTWVLQRRLCLKTRWSWRFRSLVFCRTGSFETGRPARIFASDFSRFLATFGLFIFASVHVFMSSIHLSIGVV